MNLHYLTNTYNIKKEEKNSQKIPKHSIFNAKEEPVHKHIQVFFEGGFLQVSITFEYTRWEKHRGHNC